MDERFQTDMTNGGEPTYTTNDPQVECYKPAYQALIEHLNAKMHAGENVEAQTFYLVHGVMACFEPVID